MLNWDTVVMTWVVMGILTVFGILVLSRLNPGRPSGMQAVAELAVEFVDGLVKRNTPGRAGSAFPVMSTLFLFILVANLLGLVPGLRSPTADINVTLALAVSVFATSAAVGIRTKGLDGYLREYFEPNLLFLPLNLIEAGTRIITLAFRLFGNMFAGDVLILVLAKLVAFVVPLFGQLFHVFISVLQAYLFTMLSISYVAMEADPGHSHGRE
ncbi:MAG: F0F1 ATP synthase subunit A [Firmicutes bacterium]|nr:F0F1 ATP synthase subunit A [Bacillota bacterium]